MKKLFSILCLFAPLLVQAQQTPLFVDDFENGNIDSWTIVDDVEPVSGPSNWLIEKGELKQTSNIWSYNGEVEFIYHLGTHAVSGELEWTDYSVNAVLTSNDDDGIGLIFRYQDSKNYYRILLLNDAGNSGAANSTFQRIQKFVDGEPTTLFQNKITPAFPNGYFALTADVRGDTIRAYLDGELIGEAIDSTYSSGKVGVLCYANSGARFDDITVTEEKVIFEKPDRTITYPVDQDRQPYIQNPTVTGVEIAWRSLVPAIGTVEYGEQKGDYTAQISEPKEEQKHHIKIDGLKPNTKYFYRVKNGNNTVLEDYSFNTAKPDSLNELSFLILGDSGVNSDTQRLVRDEMVKSHNADAADFLIHVGDVHQGDGSDYDPIYFDVYKELLSKMNFYLSIGNHDTYTNNAAPYLDDFYYPTNNADSTERYYSYRWANSFFINIDSNLDMRKGSPQYIFIEEALKSERQQTAMWTFAYFHHPPYCEFWPEWDGHDVVREDLMPLFESYGVDIVFNGHTHAYEHGELNGVHYVISGGGGGSLDPFGRDVPHISYSEAVYHYSRVDINDTKLSFKAVDRHGELVDRFTITKDNPTSINEDSKPIDSFKLSQNYPNPFNPETNISYQISKPTHVQLNVYDVSGRKVATVVDEFKAIGSYNVVFNAKHLASGTYVYRIITDIYTKEQKMTLLK
tara:strand:+ start:2744 stop:4792 length:2049 start_codon:yes stop_codon:yes gene_type:complete